MFKKKRFTLLLILLVVGAILAAYSEDSGDGGETTSSYNIFRKTLAGEVSFSKPIEGVSQIVTLYPNEVQIITKADS